ncbi:hypothetical protein Xbed_02496 [Xenorhabdus beddingii]|uniref:Uncharacterized protein n=1 Tax=Xenorhabdus beddingii TaxID=40578 RepID=A0A1Y2SNK1_9GAMM|nr:hypothetical protein Xbed_02496 [Xenorhabdus beddingii]
MNSKPWRPSLRYLVPALTKHKSGSNLLYTSIAHSTRIDHPLPIKLTPNKMLSSIKTENIKQQSVLLFIVPRITTY